MKHLLSVFFLTILSLTYGLEIQAREREFHVVTSGDVHGAWFSKSYIDAASKNSLMSVMHYVDSLRSAVGKDKVLLLDAGDCLQGDNSAYYYNYVDTTSAHLFPRIAAYMGYDAIVVGNHDIETGHSVYDRVNAQLKALEIPWLGGNALRIDNKEPYFTEYKIFKKGGLNIAVLGFTNPNMKAWLSEPLWRGMDFVSLLPFVQQRVDALISAKHPDIVIVAVHSGVGEGDGTILEDQGLDLLNSLQGVDLILTGHDHIPLVKSKGSTILVDGGARAAKIGHIQIKFDKRFGKLKSKSVSAKTVNMDKKIVDQEMEKHFAEDFSKVRDFTKQYVGSLAMDIKTKEAFTGMSDYINMLHTVQLTAGEAQISFAAPLSSNSIIKAGDLIYNDIFTLYTYENQLFVLKLSGSEIRKYLEYSYNNWIQEPGEHVLRIENRPDVRAGSTRWSFKSATYNFDSAGGLVYSVDITKPYGSRVAISSLASGEPFDEKQWYNVAMTSYRANGGGDLIISGAGLKKEEIDGRIIARYPEIREMLYQFIRTHTRIDSSLIGDKTLIGQWYFVPEAIAAPKIEEDMKLIF